MLHGPINNKRYVQRVIPFAKAATGLENDVRPKHAWHIYDSRSKKLLTAPCNTQSMAWRTLANVIRANGGYAVNHAGSKPYEVCVEKAGVPKLRQTT
jgi:hypothetical protein